MQGMRMPLSTGLAEFRDKRSFRSRGRRVLALCGGVGGAKLALGLARTLGPDLVVMVNTGDDFAHLGLQISPDLDTTLYTLAGLNDEVRGWGRAGETWTFMSTIGRLGGETWFQLGDGDLALHVERTRRLAGGETLTQVMVDFARRLGVSSRVIPMSDDPVRTFVRTRSDGVLPFQRYFVERRCAPIVTGLEFRGAQSARPSQEALELLRSDELAAVVICPSNPYLSVDPMLAMGAMRRALAEVEAPVVAVSPLIGGAAVKGPTAKIMMELNIAQTSIAVASHYAGLIDGLLIDEADAVDLRTLGARGRVTRTLMRTLGDRERLAQETIAFAQDIRND